MINMDNMVLNKKIRKGMRKCSPDLTYFDGPGLRSMLDELKHDELDLISFCTLADIYDIHYKFTFNIKSKDLDKTSSYRVMASEDNGVLWNEIDALYYMYTGKIIDSGCMTYRELESTFYKINCEISFE